MLVRELYCGFDKSVLREAETVELCHRGCHYIFTCHSHGTGKRTGPTYCMKSHPAAYACLCKTNRDASSVYVAKKICCSILAEGLIRGPLRHAGILIYAAPSQASA